MELKTIINPSRTEWSELIKRPLLDLQSLENICTDIFKNVQQRGDEALREYTLQFDKVKLDKLAASQEEIEEANALVSEELKAAISIAKENIFKFHTAQKTQGIEVSPMKGVVCRQESRAIEKVGIYIPGGTAPLFSTVLMLAIPAKIAGCEEVIMCTPPNSEGKIHPAILYAANLCGVDKIFKLGGVQAIAAMTQGTESIPSVYKLFGPGNQYVVAAKQLAQRNGVAIDMPAGPSELLVIADNTCIPQFVASDLLSQAEHGEDSQVILLSTDINVVNDIRRQLEILLSQISRTKIAIKALSHSRFIVLNSIEECIIFSNTYAPEHLILAIEDYNAWTPKIKNAGSVFLGNYTPESAGDYASGTNHTLPTNGFATSYSGVNLDAFQKKITFQEITPQGISKLSKTIEVMAENELLEAHSMASRLRREFIDNQKI